MSKTFGELLADSISNNKDMNEAEVAQAISNQLPEGTKVSINSKEYISKKETNK